MIVITNASGFAANAFIKKLNNEGYNDLVLVDELKKNSIVPEGKKYTQQIDLADLINWIPQNQIHIQFVFHFEQARAELSGFTKQLWNSCIEFGLPFVYARQDGILETTNDFTEWIDAQVRKPYFWANLSFKEVETEDTEKQLTDGTLQLPAENLAEVLYFFMHHRKDSGTYQLSSKEGMEKLGKIGFHKILS